MRETFLLLVSILFTRLLAFPQYASLQVRLHVETTDESYPDFYYLIDETVVYQFTNDSAGNYEVNVAKQFDKDDAWIAIKDNQNLEKLTTISKLDKDQVMYFGDRIISLTLCNRYHDEDFKLPENCFFPTNRFMERSDFETKLLNQKELDSLCAVLDRINDSLKELLDVIIVAETREDSLFCSSFIPEYEYLGTYSSKPTCCFCYPTISGAGRSLEEIETDVCSLYKLLKKQAYYDAVDLGSIQLVVDEEGRPRGLWIDILKSQKDMVVSCALVLLKYLKNEDFNPSIDYDTGMPVPDFVSFPLRNCK
ncbi:MAG: hypothetical protein IKW82_08445 [Bacteroidales bacterium]|nr:hypothetical protein [Bacteroidales bacterium]